MHPYFSISSVKASLFVAALLLLPEGSARKITITNSCSGTVWPAYSGYDGAGITVNGKAGTGGWMQAPGQSDVMEVPDSWRSARIWPRTGCQKDGSECIVGDCGGGCDGTKSGASGATLAEFTLNSKDETFDISMVDGFNVPMRITPTGGTGGPDSCVTVECGVVKDILTMCDPSLAYPKTGDTIWSCYAPCTAKVQFTAHAVLPFNYQTAPVCCPPNNAAACPTNTIPFYDVYKPLCSRAFVYAPDPNGNVQCSGPEYKIEFCPGGKGVGANPKGVKPVAQNAGGAITGGDGTGTNNDGPSADYVPYQAAALSTGNGNDNGTEAPAKDDTDSTPSTSATPAVITDSFSANPPAATVTSPDAFTSPAAITDPATSPTASSVVVDPSPPADSTETAPAVPVVPSPPGTAGGAPVMYATVTTQAAVPAATGTGTGPNGQGGNPCHGRGKGCWRNRPGRRDGNACQ